MALTLFHTLTQQTSSGDIDGDVAGGPSSSPSSSSSTPEIIQLYSNTVFDFLNSTIVNLATNAGTNNNDDQQQQQQFLGDGVMNSSRRQFSALSYQAVQTLGRDTDDEDSNNNNGGVGLSSAYQQQEQRQHLRPDLGVWDCRVDVELAAASSTNTVSTRIIPRASTLLQQVVVGTTTSTTTTQKKTEAKTILMTIDISSNNNVLMFTSIIEEMRNVILGAYTTNNDSENNDMSWRTTSASTHTTSMKSLQHATFGKAHINEVVTTEGGDNDNIALILAAIVPSSPSSTSTSTTTTSKGVDEYSERQTRALLSYHLRKFALELNCTLCFVSSCDTMKSSSNNKVEEISTMQPSTTTMEDPMISGSNAGSTTMSIDELACVVRRIALGMSPIDVIVEGEQHKSSSLPLSSIYIPGTHDAELVYGPYLRNASCEGKWDANVDDLDVAFPPPPTKTTTTMTSIIDNDDNGGIGEGGAGDEGWLSQLATSIGITTDAGLLSPLHKPPTTPKPGVGGGEPAGGGGKEKTSVPKKRVTRLSSTRNKDTTKTPKDEKEVMNFFDNLLKK